MHRYSVLNIKSNILILFYVIICVLSIAVTCLINIGISCVIENSCYIFLQSIFETVPIIVCFQLFKWLFEKYSLKIPCFCYLVNITNLNGCWKGKLISSYDHNEYNIQLNIIQTLDRIKIEAIFDNSISNSYMAAIETKQNDNLCYLYFNYKNNANQNVTWDIRKHDGFNELVYRNSDKTLTGSYFTNRGSGTSGTIKLEKIG